MFCKYVISQRCKYKIPNEERKFILRKLWTSWMLRSSSCKYIFYNCTAVPSYWICIIGQTGSIGKQKLTDYNFSLSIFVDEDRNWKEMLVLNSKFCALLHVLYTKKTNFHFCWNLYFRVICGDGNMERTGCFFISSKLTICQNFYRYCINHVNPLAPEFPFKF